MSSIVFRIVANGVALWVASLIVPGIVFGTQSGVVAQVFLIGAVGLVFGALNAVLRPILFVLSLPLMVLTLGLFTFVLNAIMLWITSWVAEQFGLSFEVQNFLWDAVVGALIISIVSTVLNIVSPSARD